MGRTRFVWLVSLSGLATGMAVVIVLLSAINDQTQRELQARQIALNSGVLGAQGQQVSAAILQDMANASATDPEMRLLLQRYGYNVQIQAADANASGRPNEETRNE